MIVVSLAVTVVFSLLSPKGKVLTTFKNAKRHAVQYLDLAYETDPATREANYARLMKEEAELAAVPEKYDALLKGEQQLLDPVSYTHLDVYKRQPGHRARVRDGGHPRRPRRRPCLLYTSRCV